ALLTGSVVSPADPDRRAVQRAGQVTTSLTACIWRVVPAIKPAALECERPEANKEPTFHATAFPFATLPFPFDCCPGHHAILDWDSGWLTP
ncbi:MAG: hypothetical protein KDD77_18310, partial [Caldilineaceae bacterium]|nr:hypothetical protein [Caldilineaceae bacterium]